MNATVKHLVGNGYNPLQVTFTNGLIGFICTLLFLVYRGNLNKVKTKNPLMGLYVLSAICAAFLIFYGFGHSQLAQANTIIATSPLIVAGLSVFILKERLTTIQTGLIFLGFLGVLLVFRPDTSVSNYLGLCALLAGSVMFSTSQVLVRKMHQSEYVLSFTFYFYMTLMATSGLVILSQFKIPDSGDLLVFLLSGICDVLSLVFLYSGLSLVQASRLAPVQYTQIIWSAIFGYIFWSEKLDGWIVSGACIVMLSGLLFLRISKQKSV